MAAAEPKSSASPPNPDGSPQGKATPSTGQSRLRRILALALPIVGGMISQNLLNLVDTFMVGRLGDAALAGVGLASFANFLTLALITGLSSGVQAISARRLGEGKSEQTALSLNGGLLLALGLGAPLSVVIYYGASTLFPLLVDQQNVVDVGVGYWQMRALSIVAVGINFSFRGFWNGVGESWRYFITLLVMHLSNIAISYALIFGVWGMPEMGADGAGLGSSIATFLGTLVYFVQGLARARPLGFLRGLPSREVLINLLRLSTPAGIQQLFFAGGMTAFFTIVGRVGTRELAVSQVLVNLLLLAVLPGMGFGMAAGSLVGQALGRSTEQDARRWGWDVAKLAVGVIAILVIPGLLYPQLLLRPFLTDPETLALGVTPLRVICVGLPIDTLGLVLMHGLIGAGDAKRTMLVSVATQWIVAIPLAYVVGPVVGLGLVALWLSYMSSRILNTGVFAAMWQRSGWTAIRV
ncbi:MAG: MATE family efflux transporter [Myxococcales bacterium]|nr:MATE family efflux transporter [Myxococcales bacterium]